MILDVPMTFLQSYNPNSRELRRQEEVRPCKSCQKLFLLFGQLSTKLSNLGLQLGDLVVDLGKVTLQFAAVLLQLLAALLLPAQAI